MHRDNAVYISVNAYVSVNIVVDLFSINSGKLVQYNKETTGSKNSIYLHCPLHHRDDRDRALSMKILHTSDWHLGQHFISKSRAQEHHAFMRWLLEQVELHQVAAVIVAGDIFDTGTPPSYARELYNEFVVSMSQLDCQLIVLAGNHDSVAMLNESKQLVARLNTQVITRVEESINEQLVTLTDKQGQPIALVCATPFVRPRDVLRSQAQQSSAEKQLQLSDAISQHYTALYDLALAERAHLNVDIPIIATGHLTAVGVSVTESVRDIYIGTLDAFPANLFPNADYIALGHIHRAQKVAKTEHIRYSGSPIALSFDEAKQQKTVNLVTFDASTFRDVEQINIPTFQPMASLKGNLDEISTQLAALSAEDDKPVWLSVEVAEQDYLQDLQARIEAMTAGMYVEVLQVKRVRQRAASSLQRESQETLSELSVEDVFQRCLDKVEFSSDEEKARKARLELAFKQVVEQVNHQSVDQA